MRGIIYKYTNKVNGKVYIGQTTNEEKRRKEWRYKNKYSGVKINNARCKYGVDNWLYEVIYEINSDNETEISNILNDMEILYITLYDSLNKGYNSTEGGDGVRGYVFTDDVKEKISQTLLGKYKGENSPLYGKHLNESTKQKLSNIHRCSIKCGAKKVYQYNLDGTLNKIYGSCRDAGRDGYDYSSVAACCRNNFNREGNNIYRGFKWSYEEL